MSFRVSWNKSCSVFCFAIWLSENGEAPMLGASFALPVVLLTGLVLAALLSALTGLLRLLAGLVILTALLAALAAFLVLLVVLVLIILCHVCSLEPPSRNNRFFRLMFLTFSRRPHKPPRAQQVPQRY